jgi:hypothetical protein
LSVIVSTLTALTAILSSAFFIDARYAHAEDIIKKEAATAEIIKRQTAEIQTQSQVLRRSLVEDKIFELDSKRDPKTRNLTIVDEAQYKRYNRQLEELNKVIPANSQVLPK